MTDVHVTTVLGREEVLAGTIHRSRTSASFVYASDWLRRKDAFALAPALGLFPGAQSLSPTNPFSDSAPDTWGRKVQDRAAGRTLDEFTLMFGVADEGRQGATRFWEHGVAVTTGTGVPVEADLSDILRIADQLDRGDADVDDVSVRRLFRATGSLGGARPKANVRIGTDLWLAKFPKPIGDEWNVTAWEAATLDAMATVGIDVPEHRTTTVTVDGAVRTVLLLRRFDRGTEGTRIPYISGMTALEATDGEGGDWLDLVDFARTAGADTTELWRRAVFGSLVGNLDDHLRNHGFLRRGPAWVLSPAFDVNPTPLGDGDEHELALFGTRDVEPGAFFSRDALDLFGVRPSTARALLDVVPSALEGLPRRARAHGADARSIDVLRSRVEAATARARLAAAAGVTT